MTRPALSVENLGKAYRIGLEEEAPDTLLGSAARFLKAPARNLRNLRRLNTRNAADDPDIVWALRDVNFEVQPGEVVGVIGRNGAGKSTLLKILSRITEPTTGHAIIRGRVSSLLEVGTGFHPDLSGRDNVYMNGTILGMTKREIDAKFDEIAAFSGVEKFLDTPIKRYSSGMKVRLAFSVAAHLEPEILVIDEVLAVGDAEFQAKCLGKMQDVAGQGRTVLFVSHNMAAVQSLCSVSVLLEHGLLRLKDETECVVEMYSSSNESTAADALSRQNKSGPHFKEVLVLDPHGAPASPVRTGDCVTFRLRAGGCDFPVGCLLNIYDKRGRPVAGFDSRVTGDRGRSRFRDEAEFACIVEELLLRPGQYYLNVAITDGSKIVSSVEQAAIFDVDPGAVRDRVTYDRSAMASVYFHHSWVDPSLPA